MLKHYKWDFVIAALAISCGYLIGGLYGAFTVAVLSVLEVSLSFDNAVVNASVLTNWDDKWRQRFLVWGMLVAVFGMRLIFPVLIVMFTAGLGLIETFTMAIKTPELYAAALKSVHFEIAAFGGTFLLMVFLKYFLDRNKDEHWIEWLEKPLAKVGRLDMSEVVIAVLVLIGMSSLQGDSIHQMGFLKAGIWGLIVYILADAVGALVGGDDEDEGTKRVIQQGIGGFLYLELLDASFSFDGVIGAFALSTNIFIIMLGLGVGALFVRSMTVHLVASGTLSTYKWLEAGAFWAIGVLSATMFIGTVHEIPEAVTGLSGAVLIGAALWSSILHNRKQLTA